MYVPIVQLIMELMLAVIVVHVDNVMILIVYIVELTIFYVLDVNSIIN